MTRWRLARQRLQQKRNALQLLTLSGVVRSAGVDPSYFRIGTSGECAGDQQLIAERIPPLDLSVWSMKLKQLWHAKPSHKTV